MSRSRRKSSALLLLAGGRGTRIATTVPGKPKALLPIAHGVSLVETLLAKASRQGLNNYVVADGAVYTELRKQGWQHRHHTRLIRDRGSGTGSALIEAIEAVNEDYVVVANCDTLTPFDPLRIAKSLANDYVAVQAVTRWSVQNQGAIGVAVRAGNPRIEYWGEGSNTVMPTRYQPASSTGVYMFDRRRTLAILTELAGAASLETEIMPFLASAGLLAAAPYQSSLPVFDYGTSFRWMRITRDERLRRALLGEMSLTRPSASANIRECMRRQENVRRSHSCYRGPYSLGRASFMRGEAAEVVIDDECCSPSWSARQREAVHAAY